MIPQLRLKSHEMLTIWSLEREEKTKTAPVTFKNRARFEDYPEVFRDELDMNDRLDFPLQSR